MIQQTESVQSTIAAIATPLGRGGIGIIRLSGPASLTIAKKVLQQTLKPRHATFCDFYDADHHVIDQGVALYFAQPNSFTGEHVVELQGHGGPAVLDLLLQTILQYGAKMAEPGEFSKRAFLNGKMDLTQAEAVADLIAASSAQAARCAMRSLQGVFSKKVQALVTSLIQLRMAVEAAIDFSDQAIEFLEEQQVQIQLEQLILQTQHLQSSANQGVTLQEGMTLVIAGKPNAGKSSLLNALSGHDRAIVTDIPGTTRDILREQIHLDGLPLHLIDTAGLRQSEDPVEKIGIKRAWQALAQADAIVYVVDARQFDQQEIMAFFQQCPQSIPFIVIKNKIDLTAEEVAEHRWEQITEISTSVKENLGLDLLKRHLKKIAGIENLGEDHFSARRRHLEAIDVAYQYLQKAKQQLQADYALELMAEDLRLSQQSLSSITGEFSSDDLLGVIFSQFCIGK